MVARLEGKVNGHEILFTRKAGDTWEGVFPVWDKYEAVIELAAYDEAGNFCYKTCYLLAFDPDSLYMRLVPIDFWLEPVLEDTMLLLAEPAEYALEMVPESIYLICMTEGEELTAVDLFYSW